ncbi:MAG: hypothetical protein AB8C95_05770 [Phycisphaeraceae bacterium]
MLLVLIAVAMCTIMALSFLAAQGPTAVIASNIDNKAKARAIAESALQMAIDYVNENADWRSDKASGVWIADVSLDGGSFTLSGIDEGDDDLSDDTSHAVLLSIVSKYGGVTHRVSARVTPGVAEETTNRLLFVAGQGSSISAQDQAKKDLFESWGYVVTVIDDSDAASVYESAAANSDLIFISEEVNSGSVNTKLRDHAIGIVTDEGYLHDDFGLTSGNGATSASAADIDLVDTDHAITKGFDTGSLVFINNAIPFRYVTSSIASGVTVLADTSGTGTEAVMLCADIGDTLHHGPAVGRRVIFPSNSDLDVNDLTSNGLTLLQRSLRWVAGEEEDEVLLEEDFESPDVTAAQSITRTSRVIPTGWIGATKGYKSNYRGIADEAYGDFTDPVGEQAFAFRYTNSGLSTSSGTIGTLVEEKLYTLSFDVVLDNYYSGTYYLVELVAYDSGDNRAEMRVNRPGTILASGTGNATTDGEYGNVTLTFIADAITHADSIGKDLAVRMIGGTRTATIDHVVMIMGEPKDEAAGVLVPGKVIWDELD